MENDFNLQNLIFTILCIKTYLLFFMGQRVPLMRNHEAYLIAEEV